MAVLGVGGRLKLKREAPSPCILSDEGLNADQNYYASICDGYWTGDQITVDCLPVSNGKFPPNPAGYASYYGSKWFLGPNRTQIDSNRDKFYKNSSEDYPDGQFGDNAQFYARTGDVSGGEEIPPCTPGDYWIHIDELGRVSFYDSRCKALAGCTKDQIQLESVGDSIVIAPYGSIDYVNAVWQCLKNLGEYRFSDGQDTVTLVSICEDPPLYQKPEAGPNEYNNADLQPRGLNQGKAAPFWEILCEIREWSLELDAPAVDTTSVAEKWGNAVKSLVTGGGSAEFFIDRVCHEQGQADSLTLMKLLLLTEKGSKAEMQLWMIDRPGCGVDCDLIQGDLYYETDVLVTRNAINVRPTEMIAGTAQFVTTGEIRLIEAS
jgi:hypothetical protein